MKVVGLTGGIGSGKTTAAGYFEELGVAVYNSDVRAKWLMNHSEVLKKQITALLGDSAYREGRLNRFWIAQRVFRDRALLEQLNAIVHPAVARDFSRWSNAQSGDFVLKEAAILFESGVYKRCEAVVTVAAAKPLRLRRLRERPHFSETSVEQRMEAQWADAQRIAHSDYVIQNDGDKTQLKRSVTAVYQKLKEQIRHA